MIRTEFNLYQQLDLPDFASQSEVWSRLEQLTETENIDHQLAIEILKAPEQKNAFDMLLEAASRADQMLPRFASEDDADIVKSIAIRLGFRLNEVFPNTFEVVANQEVSEPDIIPFEPQSSSITLGPVSMDIHSVPFVANQDLYSRSILLNLDDPDVGGARYIKDQFVQKEIQAGHRGTLFQLTVPEEITLNGAIYCSNLRICHPLSEAGRYFFTKSGNRIAAYFGIRNSDDRIQQLVRSYYSNLANAISRIDTRINRKLTLKSFMSYAKRHFI